MMKTTNDITRPDNAANETVAAADRAAGRALRITIGTLLVGAFAFTYFATRRHNSYHNEKVLSVPPFMLIGHAWGTIEALRALRGQCTRRVEAMIALAINGVVGGIILLLGVVMLIGVAVWAEMGR